MKTRSARGDTDTNSTRESRNSTVANNSQVFAKIRKKIGRTAKFCEKYKEKERKYPFLVR
jgi:hypothetical protein